MSTSRMPAASALAEELYTKDGRPPVLLLDVGCSGGIEPHWRAFGHALQIVGFDPLVAEIERLKTVDPNGTYEAAFVGFKDYDSLLPEAVRRDPIASRDNGWHRRCSTALLQRLKGTQYTRDVFNSGQPVVHADRHLDLDDYAAAEGIERIDFLKVDTDGTDYRVLLGAQKLLARSCLGVSIEVQFLGPAHPHSDSFSSIDLLLRQSGFTLIDLECARYTRSALPGPFCYDTPSQTKGGAVLWGEAIYARDLADPDYRHKANFPVVAEDVLKLAVFYEISGFPDCAAELLVKRRSLIEGIVDVDRLLDRITPDWLGPGKTHAEYMAAFMRDPEALLPHRLAQPVVAPPIVQQTFLQRILGRHMSRKRSAGKSRH